MALTPIGRIRVNVTGARGPVGVDIEGTPSNGQVLVKTSTGPRTFAGASSLPAGSVIDTVNGNAPNQAPSQRAVNDAVAGINGTLVDVQAGVAAAAWSNIYVTPTVVFGDIDQSPSLENFKVQVDRNGNLAEISIRFTARDKTGPDANTPPSGQLRITGIGVVNNGLPKEMQMRESGLPDGAYGLFDGDVIGFWLGDAPAEPVTADMIDGPYWVRMTQTTTVLPPEETA